MTKLKLCLFLTFISINGLLMAQTKITGIIVDIDNEPLPGASVIEKGTSNGATTDFDGKFNLSVNPESTLIVSFVGYETKELPVNGKSTFKITLQEGMQLEEVVITGSRTPARSNTASPLPIDIVGVEELKSTGQVTFDKALQYKIPSFNTVQTPVNDATSLLDPYEIRNLGPSRTLILINGKRKNLSSLLYTQTSPGRGETGSDISAIPVDAIKTIEILRDGASAQYGSDAIAGVMNIILKDDYKNTSATFRTGITSEGDGEMVGISLNGGEEIGDDKGFINYTIDFSKIALANRPGTVDAEGEADDVTGFGADLAFVEEFLSRNPDANNINGSPSNSSAKFLINGGFDLSEKSQLYFNAAYVYKKVNSFANYRTPYWRTLEDFQYLGTFFPGSNPNTTGSYTDDLGTTFNGNGYDGYLPTFEGDLNDFNATLGVKGEKNGWNIDASITVGGNKQSYKVNNSHNRSLTLNDDGLSYLYRENSPISFDPGGTSFSHVVGNVDFSKILSDKISVAVGSEFRAEVFTISEGDLASYDGQGADSFNGNSPENSGRFTRSNVGGYGSISYDATEDLLFEGTLRAENYSDFGTAFVWKTSSRYKFADDKYTLRASYSTGFRAPTLHQIFTQKSQNSFSAGSGIITTGLVNNVSPEARQLGVASLKAEKSKNFTVGLGAKPIKNLSFTFDYYSIKIDDRIVLSRDRETDFGTISFFSNAIDTETTGVDFVASYNNINIGDGKLGFSLSGNYTIKNERTDDNAGANDVLNDEFESLLFTSRPATKWILGTSYKINKFNFSLGNTYFGKTTFNQNGLDDNLKTEFIPKIVTDLGITFSATEKITISANVNNIFNILPEWEFVAENADGAAILADEALTKEQSNLITFNQRYAQTTYDGYHFSQLGTMFNLSLNYQF